MVSRSGARLPDAGVKAEVAHQLFRVVKAADRADGRGHRERYHHIDAGNCHQPFDAIIGKRRASEIAFDDLEVLAKPIELTQVPFDC